MTQALARCQVGCHWRVASAAGCHRRVASAAGCHWRVASAAQPWPYPSTPEALAKSQWDPVSLYLVVDQLVGRFGKLVQLRSVVEFRIGHPKAAYAIGGIGLYVDDSVDLLQSALNQGGTATSRHVGYFETDQRQIRACRIDGRLAADPSCGQTGDQQCR